MLEIRGSKAPFDLSVNDQYLRGFYRIDIKRIVDNTENRSIFGASGSFIFSITASEEVFKQITECRFPAISKNIESIKITAPEPNYRLRLHELTFQHNLEKVTLLFKANIDLKNWKEAYSYQEYRQEIDRLVEATD